MLRVEYLLSNPPTTAILGAAADILRLWHPLWGIQSQGYLRLRCGLCRPDVERYMRLFGLNILGFEVRDTFSGQLCQMGISLGGKADVCRNDGLRWHAGPEVILVTVRADVAE